jgi:hypothetical protein
MRNRLGVNSDHIDKLVQEYLRRRNKTWLKNLQYFALTMLLRKELFWRSMITRRSVEDRVQVAFLWLLLTLDEDGHIERKFLHQSCAILKGYAKVECPEDNIAFWRHVKDSLMTYSTFAFAVMGM